MPHIIRCHNGRQHTHSSVEQVAACYGQGRTQYSRTRAMNQPTPTVTARIQPPPMDEQLRKMLLTVQDGRYAVQPDETKAWTFLRLSRPKTGRSKGLLKIQYQASESYLPIASLSLTTDYVTVYDKRWFEQMMLLVCDPTTAAYEYGRRIKRCTRCYFKLTDDRSLHYGIGPECEKYWPALIAMVDEKHGPYVPRER